MSNFYGNKLQDLMSGNYGGTPGFQFALNSGMDGVSRKFASMGMGNSGNVLAELSKYGTGLASQDYGAQMDRLGKLSGQEQQYELGQGQNANAATRNANDLSLGAQRNANDLTLGQGQINNTRNANDQQFGVNTMRANNDLTLGHEQNANARQRNWYDYSLGSDRNNLEAANNQNQYNLGQGRNAIDWYNAGTNRGSAQAGAYQGEQANQRAWYSINPKQRIGYGGNGGSFNGQPR